MRCDEVLTLQTPYLDSELDAKNSLEIEEHLKSCPECRRLFAEAQRFEEVLRGAFQRGESTNSFWHKLERRVRAASHAGTASPAREPADGWVGALAAVRTLLERGWDRAPWVWAGLAAAWVLIFVLNTTARDTGPAMAFRPAAPTPSELHLALKQKRILMAELALPAGSSTTETKKSEPPRPRSERQNGSQNT